MSDKLVSRVRYGEAFWRAHHEAWRCSELNQRKYCEAQGIPLKAFGNWRAKFKAEPKPPARKLLYRRGGLSHSLSHSLSHTLSHMTYGPAEQVLIIAPAREGHRRKFSEADKRRIVEEAVQPGASLSEVARRYGIAARVLFRWKQELSPTAAPIFVTVQIADASSDAALSVRHDTASSRRKGALGLRLYRYAQGHRRGRHAGPVRTAAGSVLGPPLRLPGSESQPHQDRVLGRDWSLPLYQAARTGRLSLALERRAGWDAGAELATVVDAD
jgi:transposase-like protein